MADKVAIVADSIACLTREQVEQYGITIAPIPISFQGKIYRDWVDITPSEAYEFFLQDPGSFKTAGASPGIFLEAYRQASKQAHNILCLTLSARLSGACEAASTAITGNSPSDVNRGANTLPSSMSLISSGAGKAVSVNGTGQSALR